MRKKMTLIGTQRANGNDTVLRRMSAARALVSAVRRESLAVGGIEYEFTFAATGAFLDNPLGVFVVNHPGRWRVQPAPNQEPANWKKSLLVLAKDGFNIQMQQKYGQTPPLARICYPHSCC